VALATLMPSWQAGNAISATKFPLPVYINTAFTPGAASRTLNLKPSSGTGDAITITGQVTSVVVTTQSFLVAQDSVNVSKISYKVANAGDAVAINVAGYQFFL
jgi:hypothetical protein